MPNLKGSDGHERAKLDGTDLLRNQLELINETKQS